MKAFIEAKEVKLSDILSNKQDAYKVPPYQRSYSWTQEQWEDLFEDIKELEEDKIHFLGSIVVVPEGAHRLGINYFQIVDGQQRLATLLIWLSAIRDLARESGKQDLASRLEDNFLFVTDISTGDKYPKLELGKLDNEVFIKILEGKLIDTKHLIKDCYAFFKERTSNVDLWKKLVYNILIIHINAFSHFNAFKLFETLNDRGLELSAADLLKNYFLRQASSDERIFNTIVNEWSEMYEKVRYYEPVKFIRRYTLSIWKGKISEKRLYEDICTRMKNAKPEEICDFVKNLNYAAGIYKNISECSFSDKDINTKLNDLHLIKVVPSFTLLLKTISLMEKGILSKEDILEILDMIEVFHIRWGICDLSTSRLDQIYNEICTEFDNNSSREEIMKIIKQTLYREIRTNADDEIFKKNFLTKSFLDTGSRTKYILWKLSRPTGETSINIEEIQVEHIMPQKLSNEWISYLRNKTSKSEDEILALHDEFLHKIGNLTIIKGNWNTRMSNRLFDEKKEDYKKSEFQITKDLTNYSQWTFEEINNRTEKLVEDALKIWKWKW